MKNYSKKQGESPSKYWFQWAFLMFFALPLAWQGCQMSETDDPAAPDVSKIAVNVTLERFDRAVFEMDTQRIGESLADLKKTYPDFSDFYFRYLMGLDTRDSVKFEKIVEMFVKSPELQRLYDTCQVVFGDMTDVKSELTEAFRFYKHYFPQRPTPTVLTVVTEYGIGAATFGADTLLLGLDMFLGESYRYYYYQPLALPSYVTRTMNKDHLVAKAIEALASDLVGDLPNERLLDHLIHHGKKFYLQGLLLPHTAEAVRFGITQAQVEWLYENEFQMWKNVLVSRLYETQIHDFEGLVKPAPTSPGMPQESPGNAGSWVGWRIVKQYMKNNPSATIEGLLAETDAQKILQGSRYKPK